MECVVSVPIMVLANACETTMSSIQQRSGDCYKSKSGEEQLASSLVQSRCRSSITQPLPYHGVFNPHHQLGLNRVLKLIFACYSNTTRTNLDRVPYLVRRVVGVHAVRIPLWQEYLFDDGPDLRTGGSRLGRVRCHLVHAIAIWSTGVRWINTRPMTRGWMLDVRTYPLTSRTPSPSRCRGSRETGRACSRGRPSTSSRDTRQCCSACRSRHVARSVGACCLPPLSSPPTAVGHPTSRWRRQSSRAMHSAMQRSSFLLVALIGETRIARRRLLRFCQTRN